jgi:drug/metabolite transporter (DMT)-like permease
MSVSHPPLLKATLIGQLSLLIWCLATSAAVYIVRIPAFETLFGIFCSGFILSAAFNTYNKSWKKIFSLPKTLLLWGSITIITNDILYISSFKFAPPAQIDLIICLWPILVLILSSFYLKEYIGFMHIIASILAFSSVLILIEPSTIFFNSSYIIGYILALISSFMWASYIVISRKYTQTTPEIFAFYCGLGAIFSFIIHINFETIIIPNNKEFLVIILMGCSTHSIAYYGWDYAIKRGNIKILTILPYANPILSIFALIIFGYTEFSYKLIIVSIIICFSTALLNIETKFLPSALIFAFYFRLRIFILRNNNLCLAK